ncbi:glutathione S-transferase [Shimia gijangensis]|uniref:Glutathione S-transferase n=1 Tax=Shimia gijangensis TaxID=1470563 RepID=A0A1M6D0E3_9RHOB|nr:glutathione S-transferase family protein [Shimia gijangensis]SHI66563.1 glutathione S-transferase [Shimia gijangensis]
MRLPLGAEPHYLHLMDQPLRLHYAPDNASLIVRLALEELGAPYETILVDRSIDAQNSPEYRAINPAGLIPVLETSQGPVFETAAILLWLTEAHGAMAPHPGSDERASFLKWLFYLSNTTHANLRLNFYPEKYVGDDEETQATLRAHARATLCRSFDLLEALSQDDHEWFCGADVSVVDLYVVAMLRWSALYPAGDTDWFALSRWPSLAALTRRIDIRPSVASLIKSEGMDLNPFSTPNYPNPPEGVAL